MYVAFVCVGRVLTVIIVHDVDANNGFVVGGLAFDVSVGAIDCQFSRHFESNVRRRKHTFDP